MMDWTAVQAPMLIFPLVMLAAMAAVLTLLAGRGGRGGMPFCGPGRHSPADAPQPTREDPLQVLRERYARDEIDHAEFERALDGLLHTETPTPIPHPTGGPNDDRK
jgi:hypothetical protein